MNNAATVGLILDSNAVKAAVFNAVSVSINRVTIFANFWKISRSFGISQLTSLLSRKTICIFIVVKSFAVERVRHSELHTLRCLLK